MFKRLKNLGFAAAIALASPSLAQAQTATLSAVSASDVQSILAELQITSELNANVVGQSPALVASTPGGAKFLVGFFDCAMPSAATGCKQAMISTAQSSAGIAFEDINTFNGTANVTTMVYDSSNQILIFGRNIFTEGGIGRENFKRQVYLFLSDMQHFVNNRSSSAASVSFKTQPRLDSKISSITAQDRESAPAVRRIGMSQDAATEIEMAIWNTLDVSYAVSDE